MRLDSIYALQQVTVINYLYANQFMHGGRGLLISKAWV